MAGARVGNDGGEHDPATSTFDRVAFVLPKKRMLEIEAAIADFAAGSIAGVDRLRKKTWKERRAWESTETLPLGKKDRAMLATMVGPQVDLPKAGTPVRRAFLKPALVRANRFERAKLLFPPDMLENERAMTRADIAAFDPTSPMPRAKPWKLPGAPDKTGKHTTKTVMLNSWLGAVLEDSFELSSLITVTFTVEGKALASKSPRLRGADGKMTCFGYRPDLAVWCAPVVTLARQLDRGRVVADSQGGPVTFMFAGDPVSKALEPKVARAAASIGPKDALVAFTFLHTDVLGGDWNDRK